MRKAKMNTKGMRERFLNLQNIYIYIECDGHLRFDEQNTSIDAWIHGQSDET